MFKKLLGTLLVMAFSLSVAHAQEGHPLVGTWQGDWGTSATDSHFLTLIVEWDGKTLSGLLNPGPNSTMADKITLDSSNWTVHIETELKDDNGNSVHFVADGKLDNIGSHMRSLKGTWKDGKGKGALSLERQGGA